MLPEFVAIATAIGIASYPAGWAYIAGEGVDTNPGAYHDSLSGALVESEIGFPHLHEPWADAAAQLPGRTKATTRVGTFVLWTIDKKVDSRGCRERVYRLTDASRRDLAWSMRFSACGDEQYARATEMVDWLARHGWPTAEASGLESRGHFVTEDFEAIEPGKTWESVQAKFGSASSVQRGEDGGIVVGYLVIRDRVIMRFSRERRLQSVDIERH